MPLRFELAPPDDVHYIVAALTEVRMEPSGVLCPRVVVIFASGVVNGYEVMRYAQQLLRIGNVPAMEQVFRDPGQVRVWSCGFALVEGHSEGSVISRLCDTYKLDLRTALAPNSVDQYTYEVEYHLLNEYLYSGGDPFPADTQRSISVANYVQVDL